MLTIWVALLGCTDDSPELTLQGEAVVVVDRLGDVEGPKAVYADGSHAEGVVWRTEHAEVAHIEQGRVVASSAGSTDVIGEVGERSVRWKLTVNPTVELLFVDPPSKLEVGGSVSLVVSAQVGGQDAPKGEIEYVSSDTKVLSVDANGLARGVSHGTAYVTAVGGGGQAMAEIRVE